MKTDKLATLLLLFVVVFACWSWAFTLLPERLKAPRLLPDAAENIKPLGGGWVEFDMNVNGHGYTFISGPEGALAKVDWR